MSSSIELFKTRFENRKKAREETIIYKTLLNHSYMYHHISPDVFDKYRMKDYLEKEICKDHIWEKTKDGFENRSNYSYDSKNQKIIFTRNIIFSNGVNCSTNDTKEANAYLYRFKKQISTINQINQYIEQITKPFEEEIREKTGMINKEFYYSDEHVKGSIYYSILFVKHFIADYGEMGKYLLIKWLNKLNNSSISIEELIDEYLSDMNKAKIFFESHNHMKYLRELEQGVAFDYVLLRVIEKYSPRGRYFGNIYRDIYPRKKVQSDFRKTIIKNI